MYLSKCIVLAVFLLTSFIVLVGVLSIALDQDVYPVFGSMIGVGVATSSALSALLVLLAAIASTSKLKGVLLPVISLPLLFPVFLCGLEMTTQLVVNGVMDDGAPWPYLLLCANALYLVAGINLFDPAIRE
jgi:ABC-type transport system involved in cytochrome c biogenesis permease component